MCVKPKENSSNNIPPLVNVPAICIGLFLSNIFPCNALAKSVFCSEIVSADNERERERERE